MFSLSSRGGRIWARNASHAVKRGDFGAPWQFGHASFFEVGLGSAAVPEAHSKPVCLSKWNQTAGAQS
jgi:hypothetical protein